MEKREVGELRMDRTVRCVARRSPPAGGPASFFFGGVAARAAVLAAVGLSQSAEVAADRSLGAHPGLRLRPFGADVAPDRAVRSLPAQQGVQADATSWHGLT